MTVTYAQKVGCVSKLGSFRRVMSIYRGSVYKLTRYDLLLYLILYVLIAIMYRFILPKLISHLRNYHKSSYRIMYLTKNITKKQPMPSPNPPPATWGPPPLKVGGASQNQDS